MIKYDVNCLVGHWPFRKMRKNSFDDLCLLHKEHGISAGFVASLDSVFYNDPLEGDRDLHKIIIGSNYHLAATINPMLPAFCEDVDEAALKLSAKAVRVYPTYHGYDLDDARFISLCEKLEQMNIPLFICGRLEDERLEYIIHPTPITLLKTVDLVKRFPHLKIVLLSFRKEELISIIDTLHNSENLFCDTSGLKNNLFSIEKAIALFGNHSLLFGSQWPLYCFASTYLKAEDAHCTIEQKQLLYSLAETLL